MAESSRAGPRRGFDRGIDRGLSRLAESRLGEGTIIYDDESASTQGGAGARTQAEGKFQGMHRLPGDACMANRPFHDGLAPHRKGARRPRGPTAWGHNRRAFRRIEV